jgi:hypothetical protein
VSAWLRYRVVKSPTLYGAHRNCWWDVGEVVLARAEVPELREDGVVTLLFVKAPDDSGSKGIVLDADCLERVDAPPAELSRESVEAWLATDEPEEP